MYDGSEVAGEKLISNTFSDETRSGESDAFFLVTYQNFVRRIILTDEIFTRFGAKVTNFQLGDENFADENFRPINYA